MSECLQFSFSSIASLLLLENNSGDFTSNGVERLLRSDEESAVIAAAKAGIRRLFRREDDADALPACIENLHSGYTGYEEVPCAINCHAVASEPLRGKVWIGLPVRVTNFSEDSAISDASILMQIKRNNLALCGSVDNEGLLVRSKDNSVRT